MISLLQFVLERLHNGLLCVASLLVPPGTRAEWLREWNGELWQVRRSWTPRGYHSWRSEYGVLCFCLGAFADAFCLRRHCSRERSQPAASPASPTHCLLFLTIISAASYILALVLPGVRAERVLEPVHMTSGLVMIRYADAGNSQPTIAPSQYRTWKHHSQAYFDGFAFYRVTSEPLVAGSIPAGLPANARWDVARASSNLFTLLGIPIEFQEPDADSSGAMPEVILSETGWKKEFGADPQVTGRIVRIGSREARIMGIAPDGSWDLPGKVDAWVLEPDSEIVSGKLGYLVGRLNASGRAMMWASCVPITARTSSRSEDNLLGIGLERGAPGPWAIFLFALFLALLALPAITTVALSDYSPHAHELSWSRKLIRWTFLWTKITLLAPSAYFVSLDIAYGWTMFPAPRSVYAQLIASFSICLFGLSWVLHDQRQRCPVCLRRVVLPAQVGLASRTFLAWNGTELMCTGGHSLLHVPGLPTSWFSAQRWLLLDPSWEFLFTGSARE